MINIPNDWRLRDHQRPAWQHLIETDLVTGEKFKMDFVSKGQQSKDPPFLGRWQFMLAKFGILLEEATAGGPPTAREIRRAARQRCGFGTQ